MAHDGIRMLSLGRYEDLCTDAVPELGKVYALLRIEIVQDNLAHAVELPTSENLELGRQKCLGVKRYLCLILSQRTDKRMGRSCCSECNKAFFIAI